MMNVSRMIAPAILLATLASSATAQDHAAQHQHMTPAQAFEHYEAVRVALAADSLDGVPVHARQLASSAESLGGAKAKAAADALAAASSLDDARQHFGDLSVILVPIFQAARIPGVTGFMCEMKKRPWVQKGDRVANPYYGKAMGTCGAALPVRKDGGAAF